MQKIGEYMHPSSTIHGLTKTTPKQQNQKWYAQDSVVLIQKRLRQV